MSRYFIQNAEACYCPLRLYEMCRSRSPTDLSSRGIADEGREDFPPSVATVNQGIGQSWRFRKCIDL